MSSKHYIDKDELWNEIRLFYEECDLAEAENREPKMRDALGLMIMQIAEKLMSARNFSNYIYRDQMVGDAILCMVSILNKRQFNLISTMKAHVLEEVEFCGELIIKEEVPDNWKIARYTDVDGTEHFAALEPLEDKFIKNEDGELEQAYIKVFNIKAEIKKDNEKRCNLYQFVEEKSRGNNYIYKMQDVYDENGEIIHLKNNPFGYLSLASTRIALTRIRKEGRTCKSIKKLQEQEYLDFLIDNPNIQQQRIDDDTYSIFNEDL